LVDITVLLPATLVAIKLDGDTQPATVIGMVLNPILYHAYTLVLTFRYGGTLGKLAVGIRVAPVSGGRLTWRHVWLRSVVDLAASTLLVLGSLVGLWRVSFATYAGLEWGERAALLEAAVPWLAWGNAFYFAWLASEFVVVLLNRRRRALHDFIAGTVVVIATSPQILPAVPVASGVPET
jgi:uncharacterized RDD family membrane protein YckC